QQKLAVSEKQALIAELAGTAAHELNQPLTSVSGYAELILRRDPPDPMVRKAAQVILEQAGRMAKLVQRVGRVTRFETKAYVGSTRILDLDASEEPEG
ncbi:MAG: PAS domain S-box protein, partial [Myxococcales bacterium]|nr:PAS domain S-box protein [Myxococcales bacterium]